MRATGQEVSVADRGSRPANHVRSTIAREHVANLSAFNQDDLAPLRRVRVTVNWFEGRHQKHVSLTSYAADRNMP